MTLKTQISSDQSTFTDTDEFGTTITLSPGETYPFRNDDTRDIACIWEEQFVSVNGIEAQRPTVSCWTSDLDDVVHGSMVEKDDVQYKVVGIEPDTGLGMTILLLEKQ